MPQPENDEAFLARVSNGRREITWGQLNHLTADDLARLATISIKVSQWPRVVRMPALWLERKPYASEGRTLASKLKSSLDGFHTLPQVGTLDAEWFFRVCIGLACDSRMGFGTSTDDANSAKEARKVLRSIFDALAGRRGRPRSRERAKVEYERKLGWRAPRRRDHRRHEQTEFFSAFHDLLNGERRLSAARRSEAQRIVDSYGVGDAVERLRREKPEGAWSELAARREAIAMTSIIFGVSSGALRKNRRRDKSQP